MRETWYVLEDGRTVDPVEVGTDDAGRLMHSSGVPVAMRGQVPHSRGVDAPEAERAKSVTILKVDGKLSKKQADEMRKAIEQDKDVKPEDNKPGYKTRESKVD